ncbi:hypothetical protein ACDX66_03745 [Peribacillus frigoritolerans]
MSNRLGLVLDVETTGLRPSSDEIIELALILFTYSSETGEIINLIDQESFLREPLSYGARRNYDQAYRIHGIPYSSVEGKSFHDEKIKTFIDVPIRFLHIMLLSIEVFSTKCIRKSMIKSGTVRCGMYLGSNMDLRIVNS